MALTVSCSQGRVAIRHNARKVQPDNANRSMGRYNEYIKTCSDLHEEFNAIFKDSVDEYNSRQKRKDRKIADYYKSILADDRKEKVAYEYVFQIGNMEDNPVSFRGDDGKRYWGNHAITSQLILREFAMDFEQRNPAFKVISSTIHMDEKTPHLHITFIPVATGYKNGMRERDSLTKALQNMGYKNPKGNLAVTQWKKDQEQCLEEKMKEYNLERKYGTGRKERLEVDVFKEVCKKANNEIKREHEEIQRLIEAERISYEVEKERFEYDVRQLESEYLAQKEEFEEIYGVKSIMANLSNLRAQKAVLMDEIDEQKNLLVVLEEKVSSIKQIFTNIFEEFTNKNKKIIEDLEKDPTDIDNNAEVMLDINTSTAKLQVDWDIPLEVQDAAHEVIDQSHDEVQEQITIRKRNKTR